jgi:hypothetical protein
MALLKRFRMDFSLSTKSILVLEDIELISGRFIYARFPKTETWETLELGLSLRGFVPGVSSLNDLNKGYYNINNSATKKHNIVTSDRKPRPRVAKDLMGGASEPPSSPGLLPIWR